MAHRGARLSLADMTSSRFSHVVARARVASFQGPAAPVCAETSLLCSEPALFEVGSRGAQVGPRGAERAGASVGTDKRTGEVFKPGSSTQQDSDSTCLPVAGGHGGDGSGWEQLCGHTASTPLRNTCSPVHFCWDLHVTPQFP